MTSALTATNGACRPWASASRLSTKHDGAPAEHADDGAEHGLLGKHGQHVLPRAFAEREKLDQDDREQHRERIVAAGFHLEGGADPRAQPQSAGVDQEEHRRGVGRGHDRADQQRLGPAHVEQVFGDRGGDRRREQDTDGRERGRRRQHAAKGGKPRAQAAVEQDQRQRDRADHVGRAHVVELDAARTSFTREHPDDQEHEQQRRSEAHCHQARHDAGQDQESAQQNADADGVERRHDPRILDPHWKCAPAARQLLISSFGVIDTPRHGRARPGRPRLSSRRSVKTWMPGTSPGMTSPV